MDPVTGDYYPTVFFNEFWLLRDKLIALNETVKELPLNLEVGPISMTKWQLFLQIEQSFQVHRSYGSMLEGEADELKVNKYPYCKLQLFECTFLDMLTSLFPLGSTFAPFHKVPLICTATCSLCPWELGCGSCPYWFTCLSAADLSCISELQRVFLQGNPYLLGLTMVVSLFHSLFDFLAFKNGMSTVHF